MIFTCNSCEYPVLHGCDFMLIRFTSTYTVSVYHHWYLGVWLMSAINCTENNYIWYFVTDSWKIKDILPLVTLVLSISKIDYWLKVVLNTHNSNLIKVLIFMWHNFLFVDVIQWLAEVEDLDTRCQYTYNKNIYLLLQRKRNILVIFVLYFQLPNHLFEELAMDVYDEVDRRENDERKLHYLTQWN